jgi:hypothetical protein
MKLGFFWRNYFSWRTNMRRRSTRVGQRGSFEPRWRRPQPRPCRQCLLAVVSPISFVLILDWRVNLKTPIQGLPEVFSWGGGRKIRDHKTEAELAKIGGRNVAWAIPGRFSNLSNIHYTTALEPQQTSWSEKPLTPTESRSGISFADQHGRSL